MSRTIFLLAKLWEEGGEALINGKCAILKIDKKIGVFCGLKKIAVRNIAFTDKFGNGVSGTIRNEDNAFEIVKAFSNFIGLLLGNHGNRNCSVFYDKC